MTYVWVIFAKYRAMHDVSFCLFVCFYKPLPDFVLLYVMFGEGGIVVSVVEMENVSDDQFCTFVLCCRLKRTVLFQGTKDD